MSRTLRPGDDISRYRIVGPLGAGGMGEVYRARDTNLDRDVALKVLPPTLVRSEERVRRFVLEAKSASSLNHPNIVTIYEIGEDQVSSSDGAPVDPPSRAHFISMELVSGDTLGAKIHDDKTDLKTLLGWMAQAADGVAKAHAAGIVHRDLKPGNIMISNDGYAKVLDFGLAKLTEKVDLDTVLSTAPTEIGNRTTEGVVLGTVGYMSPEQVRGKGVDARTDIFALGCILYECATRRRPFVAESSIETMHAILNSQPAPIEELNPAVPAELRRLIRRCLAKGADQRLQSAKDLAIELREIVDDYEMLSASATSAGSGGTVTQAMPSTGGSSGGMAPPSAGSGSVAAPPRRLPWVPILVTALVAAGVAIGWSLLGRSPKSTVTPADIKVATITNKGDVSNPIISPDGRYLAYVSGPRERRRVYVRQIATGSDIEVLSTLPVPPEGLNFSPDGNYLYYLAPDPEHPGYRGLYRVPSLGGSSTRLLYDVDSKPTFDPTGTKLAFIRGVPGERAYDLIVLDIESGRETRLTRTIEPERLLPSPEWSPDGEWIAASYMPGLESSGAVLGLVRVKDGSIRSVPNFEIYDPRDGSLAWLPDSRHIVSTGYTLDEENPFPVRLVSIADGSTRKLTATMDSWTNASVSADGTQLVAQRRVITSNLWILDVDAPDNPPKQLTFTTGGELAVKIPEASETGDIVFAQGGSDAVYLSAMKIDGTGVRSLRSDGASDFDFFIRPGGWFVQRLQRLPDGKARLTTWRYEGEAGARRPIGKWSSELLIDVSPDGQQILVCDWHDMSRIFRIGPDGGDGRQLTDDAAGPNADFSPDGTRFLYRAFREIDGQNALRYTVRTAADGTLVPIPELPPGAHEVAWSPDGRSLYYLDWRDPNQNLFRLPLDGGPTEKVSALTEGQILHFKFSPDGRRIAIGAVQDNVRNIWLMNADGTNLVQLTRFLTGDIFDATWMPDGRHLVFTYGDQADDVVMMTNFR
jgi:serine/threonine protein kinase/Tol biopolymer transport system component